MVQKNKTDTFWILGVPRTQKYPDVLLERVYSNSVFFVFKDLCMHEASGFMYIALLQQGLEAFFQHSACFSPGTGSCFT